MTDAAVDLPWIEASLHKVVAALAAPGATALTALPQGVCKADELALEFDNFYRAYTTNSGARLPGHLRQALEALAASLDQVQRSKQPQIWSDIEFLSNPLWEGGKRHLNTV